MYLQPGMDSANHDIQFSVAIAIETMDPMHSAQRLFQDRVTA
jgi:hypothetical protein